MKRQPTEWNKTVAGDPSDKGSLSKLHKELVQPNTKKSN